MKSSFRGTQSVARLTASPIGIIVAAGMAANCGPDRRPLAAVDFFGHKGLDVAAIRRVLPFQEGDSFPPANVHSDQLKKQIATAIKRVTAREPTDVAFICCDAKQHYLVYIGLPGESYEPLAFNPAPSGGVRLPKDALKLSEAVDDAWSNAVMNGHATEEDSAGYTMTNDPQARRAQLALRAYVLQHEELVMRVLAFSNDGEHRAIAAQMVGYGRQSDGQIDALV